MIDKDTDEAVKSDGFVTIEKSMLEELVERDSLNIREVELFKAAVSITHGLRTTKYGLRTGYKTRTADYGVRTGY